MKLYQVKDDRIVKCQACSWQCLISPQKFGKCQIRQNLNGQLKFLAWNKTTGASIDPIEKKPFYHFLPNTPVYSIGTWGCNFGCLFCQNAWMSQNSEISQNPLTIFTIKKSEIINYCQQNNIPSIAFTYNEPTINSEWNRFVMESAKKVGLKGVYISNGFMTKKCLTFLNGYIDAYNIDLKSFSDKFYQTVCRAKLAPVLSAIETIYKANKWLEITTLLIPNKNDSDKEILKMAKFIKNISPDIPWHLTSFHPSFQLKKLKNTPETTMEKALEIGKKVGLHFVYMYQGSFTKKEQSDTFCPKCNTVLLKRKVFTVTKNVLNEGSCPKCNYQLSGVWVK